MRISFEEAIRLLQEGQVVALPTETVYGLAASLHHREAIAKVFALKNRPPDNPLIIHLPSAEALPPYIQEWPSGMERLIEGFWPGPLTFVLSIREEAVPGIARAGLPTAAFRVPSHRVLQNLLQGVGPLVMPSANRSGSPSATRPEHVEKDLGPQFPVLDGGIAEKGIESTILGYFNGAWRLLRHGAIAREAIEETLGEKVILREKEERPIAPGQHYRHYAPQARLILSETCPAQVEAVLGFSNYLYPEKLRLFSLGSTDNPAQVASQLYHLLRKLDDENISIAWVDMRCPTEGLWATIRERLGRAAESERGFIDFRKK